MGRRPRPVVELVSVDDEVLERLVAVAVSDASAGDVTPPLTQSDEWTQERIDWLRQFHVDRRAGLSGPMAEATWAVVEDGQPVGSVRLKRADQPDEFEIGVWLSRSARGRGLGAAAIACLLGAARSMGAHRLRATTTARNGSALGVLRQLGFALSDVRDGTVHAMLYLNQ